MIVTLQKEKIENSRKKERKALKETLCSPLTQPGVIGQKLNSKESSISLKYQRLMMKGICLSITPDC